MVCLVKGMMRIPLFVQDSLGNGSIVVVVIVFGTSALNWAAECAFQLECKPGLFELLRQPCSGYHDGVW